MKTLFFSVFLCLSIIAQAQTGEIQGKVTDAKTGEPLPFANVIVKANGFTITIKTDLQGCFTIKGLNAGEYSLIVQDANRPNGEIINIGVFADETLPINVQLQDVCHFACCLPGIISYRKPLINRYNTSTGYTYNYYDIRNMPLW
jgi:hypothetical protein